VEGVRGGAADPGEYRKIQNFVVNSSTGETVYTPPPAHDVPIMMAELVDRGVIVAEGGTYHLLYRLAGRG